MCCWVYCLIRSLRSLAGCGASFLGLGALRLDSGAGVGRPRGWADAWTGAGTGCLIKSPFGIYLSSWWWIHMAFLFFQPRSLQDQMIGSPFEFYLSPPLCFQSPFLFFNRPPLHALGKSVSLCIYTFFTNQSRSVVFCSFCQSGFV